MKKNPYTALRSEALEAALRLPSPDRTAKQVTDDALMFYNFLKGGEE